jgi:uncharacterized protein
VIPGIPDSAVLVAIGAAFMAALARGFSGFGAALVFVPVASAALGPRVAIPLMLVVDFVMALPMLPPATRRCNWRDVLLMAAGAIVGVPIGTAVLTRADPSVMRWSIAVLIVLLLSVLASGWRYAGRPAVPLTAGVGLSAGILSGAAQVGGPPVVVYWLGGSIPPLTVRANLIAFFGLSSTVSLAAYLAGGLLTQQVLSLALVTAPLYGFGVWLGARMFGIASETVFRRVCYGLIALSALTSLPVLDALWR